MNIYQIIIRILISGGVLLSLYTGAFDYATALAVLSIIYFFSYIILPKGKNSKYMFLIIDTIFISIAVYLTGNAYLSLFVIPLFSEFVKDIRDIGYFFLLSASPVMISLYVSDFSELTIVPILFAGLVGIYGLYKTFIEKDSHYKELKQEMENLYIKNISFQEKIEQLSKKEQLYQSLKKLRDNRFPLKIWIYDLNEIMGTDGVIFFDFTEHKCYSTGKVECNKDILKYIQEPVQKISSQEINEEKGFPHITASFIDINGEPVGALIFFSSLKDINLSDIEFIREQLILYFLENSGKEISKEDSGITSGGKEKAEGD
ncbi:hypothetical protein [Persephonella sp.]|uniref:hypothetical protein n=1 Tax=Persephonella sp. TaxID=2060922 RepID=UPI002639D591|nr:hypothetical protein [Persephonella sp.]